MNHLLPLDHPTTRNPETEIIVVGFAGGGGTCQGITTALRRDPDEALNHDPAAVAVHRANHPGTRHWCQNIWQANPTDVCAGRPIGLAWFSPDCKHFSKAKGAAPKARNIRDLAWVVVAYAKLPRHLRPRVIMVENVEEFQGWGPLMADGQPCPDRKGETFALWVHSLKRLGYRIEWRELRACDYGAPTIRKRLFVVARCDGQPIQWPEPTHGPGRALPHRTAAEIIDWSLPCLSIFTRARPLADATLRRIARGIKKYVIETAEPFIVGPLAETRTALLTSYRTGDRVGQPVNTPIGTVTTVDRYGLVAAHITQFRPSNRGHSADEPLRTIIAGHSEKHLSTGCQFGIIAAHLTHWYSSAADGGQGDLRQPIKTVTAGGQHAGLVAGFLTAYYGNDRDGQALTEPVRTVTATDRFGLVTVDIGGRPYALTDIGLRMLTPRELFRAQGFPDSYQIDIEINGRPISKAAQVRLAGNSVCPPVAAALVAANVPEMARQPLKEAAE